MSDGPGFFATVSKYRPPRFLKKRRLQAILRRLGCQILPKRGKGAHWAAVRRTAGGKLAYTFGDHREYGADYIKPARRALELTPADGVSDEDFFKG